MQISLDEDKNVRKGLFGTALRDDKDVKFKVSLRYVFCRFLKVAAKHGACFFLLTSSIFTTAATTTVSQNRRDVVTRNSEVVAAEVAVVVVRGTKANTWSKSLV